MQRAMQEAAIVPLNEEGQEMPVEPQDTGETAKPPSPDRGDIR